MEYKLELEDFRHGKYKYEPKPGELRLVQDNNMGDMQMMRGI